MMRTDLRQSSSTTAIDMWGIYRQHHQQQRHRKADHNILWQIGTQGTTWESERQTNHRQPSAGRETIDDSWHRDRQTDHWQIETLRDTRSDRNKTHRKQTNDRLRKTGTQANTRQSETTDRQIHLGTLGRQKERPGNRNRGESGEQGRELTHPKSVTSYHLRLYTAPVPPWVTYKALCHGWYAVSVNYFSKFSWPKPH